TLLMHEPEELDGCHAVVALSGPTFRAMYRPLFNPTFDWTSWTSWLRRGEKSLVPGAEVFGSDELTEWEALRSVLAAAKRMWINQGERAHELVAAMTISQSEVDRNAVIEFEGRRPALVFHGGSIKISLISRFLRATGFAVSFLPGRGLAASKRAANLAEALRKAAEQRSAVERLERLDVMGRGE